MLHIAFPRKLQEEFEQEVLRGKYARHQALGTGDLGTQYKATEKEAQQVLLSACRKGLVKHNLGEVCPGLEDDDISNYFKRLLEEKYLAILLQLRSATGSPMQMTKTSKF